MKSRSRHPSQKHRQIERSFSLQICQFPSNEHYAIHLPLTIQLASFFIKSCWLTNCSIHSSESTIKSIFYFELLLFLYSSHHRFWKHTWQILLVISSIPGRCHKFQTLPRKPILIQFLFHQNWPHRNFLRKKPECSLSLNFSSRHQSALSSGIKISKFVLQRSRDDIFNFFSAASSLSSLTLISADESPIR